MSDAHNFSLMIVAYHTNYLISFLKKKDKDIECFLNVIMEDPLFKKFFYSHFGKDYLSAPAPLVLRCRLMSLNQGPSGLHRNYLVDDHRAVGARSYLAFG